MVGSIGGMPLERYWEAVKRQKARRLGVMEAAWRHTAECPNGCIVEDDLDELASLDGLRNLEISEAAGSGVDVRRSTRTRKPSRKVTGAAPPAADLGVAHSSN